MLCEGETPDTDGLSAFVNCGVNMKFVAFSDDINGIPHGVGGMFGDPRILKELPSTGRYTLMVFDFTGAGPAPQFEIHASGIANIAVFYNVYEVLPESVIDGGGRGMNELNIDVRLTDQFGTSLQTVRKAKRLLVPVDKDGEGISDVVSHLTCYDLKNPEVRGSCN